MQKIQNFVADTFEDDGLLAKAIPNYQKRTQQIELATKIQQCIKERKALIAECPTGTGKSLGALVPAFEHIKKTDEPVIVVTSSIVLQEQYINKDIPTLEKLYGLSVNPILIKGRNNFLCPKKLSDVRKGKVSYSTTEQIKEHEKVYEWAVQTEKGDKSELSFVPKYSIWSYFACLGDNECTGKQCAMYNACPYYRERNKVDTAKLVVCNYHYFFTAISNEIGVMLPGGAKVIVMDEGHEINAIARDYQEQKYSINSLRNPFDMLLKATEQAELSEVGETVMPFINDLELDMVNATLTDMFVGLGHEFKRVVTKHYTRDFWQIFIPERTRLQKHVKAHIEALDASVDTSQKYLDRFGFDIEAVGAIAEFLGDTAAEWLVSVHRMMKYLEQSAETLHFIFAFDEAKEEEEIIFWLNPYQESVSVHAKPTTGAGLTKRLFGDETEYIPIVMSATLSANQSFDHLKTDLGIDDKDPVEELIVSSPFNLEENLLWYLPTNTPAGNDPGHLNFVLNEMTTFIKEMGGRTLCLFTSVRNMQQAETHFKRTLPNDITLLSQEHLPKQKIIDHMKANDRTVILGTKSFFTGIDIQGPHLSAVLIDKFPFPMIGDPVNDHLMSQPRGFHKFSLPEAIISMKQAFGRLNRTTEDKGVVVLYDGRLSTAKYKNKIFNSFDFKINATKNWEDVVSYIDKIKDDDEQSLF